MPCRRAERHALEPGDALPVARRVVALQRRAAQAGDARDFEGCPESEWPPQDAAAVPRRQGLDLQRSEIGIAGGEVEPEFDRRLAGLARHGPSQLVVLGSDGRQLITIALGLRKRVFMTRCSPALMVK